MKGVTNAHSNFEKAFRENHWYNISGIDVYTMSNNMSAIAIMGNSITDGKCSTDNAQNRWPDVMSEMLQLKHKITNQGVLNLGIGNNRVTVPGGFGALAKERPRHPGTMRCEEGDYLRRHQRHRSSQERQQRNGGTPDYRKYTGNGKEGESPEDEGLPGHHHAFQGRRLLQSFP